MINVFNLLLIQPYIYNFQIFSKKYSSTKIKNISVRKANKNYYTFCIQYRSKKCVSTLF